MEDSRASIAARIKPAQTKAQDLRQCLAELETHVGQIGGRDSDTAALTLDLFDRVNLLTDEITSDGGSLAAELTRVDTACQQFGRKKAKFLNELGGPEELQRLRAVRAPDTDLWWWYVDERLAEERQLRKTRTIRRAGLSLAILTLLTTLYMIFLAPDPDTRQRLRHEATAEQYLTQGELEMALDEADAALGYAPDDPELLIFKGVTLEMLGDASGALALFDQAEMLIGARDAYLTERAQTYMVANHPELALADAQAIIEMAPESAMGYMVAGNAYSVLGEYAKGIESYELASQFAEAAGQTQLQGMARYQLANLMMAPPVNLAPEATPED